MTMDRARARVGRLAQVAVREHDPASPMLPIVADTRHLANNKASGAAALGGGWLIWVKPENTE